MGVANAQLVLTDYTVLPPPTGNPVQDVANLNAVWNHRDTKRTLVIDPRTTPGSNYALDANIADTTFGREFDLVGVGPWAPFLSVIGFNGVVPLAGFNSNRVEVRNLARVRRVGFSGNAFPAHTGFMSVEECALTVEQAEVRPTGIGRYERCSFTLIDGGTLGRITDGAVNLTMQGCYFDKSVPGAVFVPWITLSPGGRLVVDGCEFGDRIDTGAAPGDATIDLDAAPSGFVLIGQNRWLYAPATLAGAIYAAGYAGKGAIAAQCV